MRVADLLEEFNIVIDTKEGLSELRSLILGLAVRGKLVPQDPNDEPASELLKKIEAKKQRLYEDRGSRKLKNLTPIEKSDELFLLPKNWEWVRLGEIAELPYGKNLPTKDLLEKGYDVFGANGIIGKYSLYHFDEQRLLISCRGAYSGKTNISPAKCFVTNNSIVVSFFDKSKSSYKYFYYCITALPKEKLISGSAQPQVTSANGYKFPIPFPPLAEQHRIVQKIEALFAEVDELEAKLERQTKLDEKLQRAVNAEVQQAPDSAASKTAWDFITNNFETLYHTPEAIDNLKKNILNEAVRGRLVPQNPTDEPASELLKKIEAEKQRLYEAGEIRKPKALPPITEEEIPFEIPESWEWVKLADISISFNNGISKRSGKEGQEIPVIRLADIENLRVDLSDTRSIKLTDKELKTYLLTNDDILITRVNGSIELVGSFNIFKENKVIAYCDHFVRMNINCELIDVSFIWFSGKTSLIRAQIESQFITTAGQKTVNQRHLGNLVLPLPPLAEQHRIVQRIEELFAICDQFKAKLQHRQQVNEKLVKGLVKEVLEKASSETKENVLKTAEPKVEYDVSVQPEQKKLTKQELVFWQLLIIGYMLRALKRKSMLQGEMGLAKYVYLVDRIGGVITHFEFEQNNFGPYPSNFKKRLYSRSRYFQKSGTEGYEVIDLANNSKSLFKKETEKTSQIEDSINTLIPVFSKFKKGRSHKLELMASVCWLIEKTKKTNFAIIWKELEEWKTPRRDDVETKAELFTPEEVKKCLKYIKSQKWDKKLIER